MKQFLSKLPYIALALIIGASVAYAGSLTPPGSVLNTMYTLDDIYNLTVSGTTGTAGSGAIPSTPGSATPTFHTLTQIYDAVAAIPTGKTLKTGQTTCYDPSGSTAGTISCSSSGQDGQYLSGVSRSYTDNSDGTISDNSTGLMWVKDPSEIPGGTWGTSGSPSAMTFADALSNCEALDYAGHNDWRLPNFFELSTTLDLDNSLSAVNLTVFPNTKIDRYWTSTSYSALLYGSGGAYTVYYSSGEVSRLQKTAGNTSYVRCVRG